MVRCVIPEGNTRYFDNEPCDDAPSPLQRPSPRSLDFSTTILEAHSLGALRDNLTQIVSDHPYSSSRIRYRLNAVLLCILILFFFRVDSACAFKALSLEETLNYR